MPINFNIVKKVLTSFSNLHVEGGTIYSLPICRVHELRKISQQFICDNIKVIDLVTIAGKKSIYNMTTQFMIDVSNRLQQ